MKNVRQIRYYIITNTGIQERPRHKWTFCIINESKEIDRIKQRILRTLAPASDFETLGVGQIKHSKGLQYKAFSIKSDKGELNLDERQHIYQVDKSQFGLDRGLERIGYPEDVWFEEVYIPSVLGR